MEQSFTPYEAYSSTPPQRIGVLAPHADDEVFGPGGSLALWHQSIVSVSVVTDGLGWGQGDNLEALRQNESKQACHLLEWPTPEFWRYPDGRLLEFREELTQKITQWIIENQLECLFIPSIWEMHRDHRVCAESALLAAKQTTCLKEIWQYEIGRPLERVNRLVDISQTFDLKQQAMHSYKSQLALQNYFTQITALNIFRTYTLPMSCQAAEAFYALKADEIQSFLDQYQPETLTQQLFNAPITQDTTNPKLPLIKQLFNRFKS